jgi:hypothetical protein
MDLASIRLNVTVADQQLSDIKLTLWVILDIPMVVGVNLYAFIVFDGRQYPDKSNSCANHQFTSSRVRFLADSLVGSPNPEYS